MCDKQFIGDRPHAGLAMHYVWESITYHDIADNHWALHSPTANLITELFYARWIPADRWHKNLQALGTIWLSWHKNGRSCLQPSCITARLQKVQPMEINGLWWSAQSLLFKHQMCKVSYFPNTLLPLKLGWSWHNITQAIQDWKWRRAGASHRHNEDTSGVEST